MGRRVNLTCYYGRIFWPGLWIIGRVYNFGILGFDVFKYFFSLSLKMRLVVFNVSLTAFTHLFKGFLLIFVNPSVSNINSVLSM